MEGIRPGKGESETRSTPPTLEKHTHTQNSLDILLINPGRSSNVAVATPPHSASRRALSRARSPVRMCRKDRS
jgi:hypothetical protein